MATPMTPTPAPGRTSHGPGSMGGGLKIHSLTIDKEAWENVAPIVQKTFHGLASNLQSVKRWADRQDERGRRLEELQQQADLRLEELEGHSRILQERVEQLSRDAKMASKTNEQRFELLTACAGTLYQAVRALFTNLGKAFGFDLTWSTEEQQALAKLREGQAGETLRVLSAGLDRHLGDLDSTFAEWGSWRSLQDQRQKELQSATEELAVAAERTRERLLSWRELIRENAQQLSALGGSLEQSQATLRELQASQVRHGDVEQAVAGRASQLERLLGQAEGRTGDLARRVDARLAELQRAVVAAQQQATEQLQAHGTSVVQVLKQHFDPVSACLNTMHVKADAARVELDGLLEKVPQLGTTLAELTAELEQAQSTSAERDAELGGRVDKLVLSLADWGERGLSDHAQLKADIAQSAEALSEQVAGVRSAQEATAEALEVTRRGEIARLGTDLSTLGQKVAKWVHTQPLPAKISEARLFSLETRLTEEMDARLHLEQQVKSARGLKAAGLPQLEDGGWRGKVSGRPGV